MKKKPHKRLFLFAGEKSGDLHGGHLTKALKQDYPDIILDGVAGPQMRRHGIAGPLNMEDFEVMGFTDVIKALPKLYRHFYKIRNHILSTAPDGIILIDYPGFNLRLAKALRQKGYLGKIVQYVSPTVWAWGKHRIDEMAHNLDLLLTIYPFESNCFKETHLPVIYVGNPLCEYLAQHPYQDSWQTQIGLPPNRKIIALFPGSRKSEIERNLPIILEAGEQIAQQHPDIIFAISCAHQQSWELLKALPQKTSTLLRKAIYPVPANFTYELMRDSYASIAKSGTVTLELALHQSPTVVIYKLTPLNRFYGKYILKLNLPHYCIVNILMGKTVFPELIANGLSPDNLYKQFQSLNDDLNNRQQCQQACKNLHQLLEGHTQTSKRASTAIMDLLDA